MIRTLRDIFSLVGALKEVRLLFWTSTLTIFLGYLALLASTAMAVGITSQLVADLLSPQSSPVLVTMLTVLMLLAVVYSVSYLLEAWWAHELAYRVLAALRVRIWGALDRVAPRGLANRRIGDITSRAMGDAEELEWFYAHTAGTALNAVVAPIVVLIATLFYAGPVALLAVPAWILILAVPMAFMPLQRRQGDKLRQGLGEMKVMTLEGVHGLTELHVLGLKERHEKRLLELTARVQRTILFINLRKSLEQAVNGFTVVALSLGTIAILSAAALAGNYDAERIPMASILVSMSVVPIGGLAGMMSQFGTMGSCANRVNELLQAPALVSEEPLPGSAPVPGDKALAAEGVSFSYDADSKPVFSDLSLRIDPGERVALFGPSGVGKSTLAFMALRFLDPVSGVMRWQGRDMITYTPAEHREEVTLLPQVTYVFAGSIRDNLRLANPKASDEQMWQALGSAGLDKVISDLGGLDAWVGDQGTTLSGGERQRLGLARVFLRDYELLVLDEPLANVDPELERDITAALAKHRGHTSTLLIAHRLAQVESADRIVVLGSDGVVDEGGHAELLERCDYYRQLLHDQAQT